MKSNCQMEECCDEIGVIFDLSPRPNPDQNLHDPGFLWDPQFLYGPPCGGRAARRESRDLRTFIRCGDNSTGVAR
eukprot:snap_masked-scaffold1379_size44473-processed-gene-0.7 protein:Tk08621 transcript:snap_masked-scaffold1379_size44473-processed-gene-0.7-mRNA-1 annotation:"crispr-associated protein cas1"